MKMKLTDIQHETLIRMQAIAEKGESSDAVINNLINTVLGFSCPHTDQGIYIEVEYDERGYTDLPKTIEALNKLRHGLPTKSLLRVCKMCMRGKTINP
ncbi:hypothetical protein KAR91_69395 [Candidatus Pacearchaeota archaeon]|nr:hypothetical protein [Candidatus Pacearchaeota archaeon]